MTFKIEKFKRRNQSTGNQFQGRLSSLRRRGIDVQSIDHAVSEAAKHVRSGKSRSFVIYGEPQSGKTEMMIALTAKLLDDHQKIIIHLLNDSVSLLNQNLRRFQAAGLAPAPVNFTDVLDRSVRMDDRPFVIFCKKNQSDLTKLIDKLGKKFAVVVIDDEADYASPNAKVNQGKQTKINELISKLIGDRGVYIGVTATPARLDLNATFENDHNSWVSFPPHPQYTGQDHFFPLNALPAFHLTKIPQTAGDDPKHCREAFFSFLVNSAYLNLNPSINKNALENNYTFLIHTSGQKIDHKKDFEEIQKLFGILSNQESKNFEKYVRRIWEIAETRYPKSGDQITDFVVSQILRYEIRVLNSDHDVVTQGTAPACPFTVIIGGNIVSRGVTFDNLLSMFFTRDVKHKLQQDTYIQRARMFGSRGPYLKFFELTVPHDLYDDWQRCFVFHKLSLKSIEAGAGAPVWLSDKRIAATAAASIKKGYVSIDSGEMGCGLFNYEILREKISAIKTKKDDGLNYLSDLQKVIGHEALPQFLLEFIRSSTSRPKTEIRIHEPASIAGSTDADQDSISRKKGFMGGANFTGNPSVTHHLQIRYNAKGSGRVFFKYVAGVTFLKTNAKSSLS